MKIIIAFMALLMANTGFAADAAGNVAIWGAGKKSCFSYEKARNGEDDSYFRYYIMGYLTSYNSQAPETYSISGNKSMQEILGWLDEYCEDQKTHAFDQAVLNFVIDHYPRRFKRPPTAASR